MNLAVQRPWNAPPELPATHYLDNRIYTREDVFAVEQERIFRKTWKFACHESELAASGAYRTVSVAGAPLVLLRSSDGEVRGFYNVCPHRGAKLVRDAAGVLSGQRLQCFYHHWSFSTQGQCLYIPLAEGYAGTTISKDRIALRRVRTETVLGMVFVNLDGDAEPLSTFLGGALQGLEETLSDLEVLHYHRAEIKGNWKLFVETNAEGYHELLHLLNRTTGMSQPAYRGRQWTLHPRGHHSFAPAQIAYERLALGDRGAVALPGMKPNGHVVVDLFPDVMVNVRATVARIDSLIPVAPGLTVLECRGLGLKGDDRATRELRLRHHNQVWGPFGRNLPEDIWAVETQWANMACGASRYSIIAREEAGHATDDAPIRSFYREWRRLTALGSHDVDEPGAAEREAAGGPQVAAGEQA